MPKSQTTGRTLSTRRAHRPDNGVYRMMRLKRSGRRRNGAGVGIAMAIVIVLAVVVWLIFWR